MIPIRLEVKNFLPYRAPDPIRFEGIHLACLTGSNGAGKSSILDAITWALWGRARAKRDEELVHLGQGEMYVQLDFEQEGILWRVLRRRNRGKRGQGTLDLFIIQEDGSRTLQSEPAMRQTQAKINRILRLDYETFVHSAFLQQGKADAFTTRTPAQRKKILSDILGLDQWTVYEDKVKERLKEISNQINYFDERIKEIDTELARKPNLEAQLSEASKTHEEAQSALAIAEERLKEVEHAPAELRNAQDNKKDRETRLRDHRHDLQGVEEQIERQQKQINDYQDIIAAKDDIEAGYTALQSAREADQAFSDTLRQLRTLDEQRADLRSQIESSRARLESEAESVQRTIAELEQSVETDFEADLESVQAEVNALQEREVHRDELKEQQNTLREDHSRKTALYESLTAEGVEIRERLETLEGTDAANCPLCGQDLTEEHRVQLIEQLTEEIAGKREQWKAVTEQIHANADEQKIIKAQIKDLDAELKQLAGLNARVGSLQTQVEASQQAETRLAEELARLQTIQTQLENDTFAEEVRAELADLNAVHDELGYDQSTHDETQQAIKDNMQYEELKTRLRVALESLTTVEEGLEGAKTRQVRLGEAIVKIETEISEFEGEISRLAVLVEEYNARESEVGIQRTRERSAYERVVNARQALDALEVQAERKADLDARRDKARYDEAIHQQLKQAFGKNGIPAMIIETAIPELEMEANDLLARMTDGRMHIKMNTQREKITGGIAETLDIEIADELGTRSYELYSGGEAFRINFAIRVALSKMLARRAGAHLRTLFIDEGFGTQDEAGRNKLVEAITAIQNEFDLILVITHIDELRDSFPVHIVVDKTQSGSMVTIR